MPENLDGNHIQECWARWGLLPESEAKIMLSCEQRIPARAWAKVAGLEDAILRRPQRDSASDAIAWMHRLGWVQIDHPATVNWMSGLPAERWLVGYMDHLGVPSGSPVPHGEVNLPWMAFLLYLQAALVAVTLADPIGGRYLHHQVASVGKQGAAQDLFDEIASMWATSQRS